MGRVRTSRRKTSKNKASKKRHDTKRRRTDIDQVQDNMKKEEETGQKEEFELDEDLPGLGQFFCSQCSRHFSNQETLTVHEKTKPHKRR
jgi:bud site selection protein 20